LFFYRQKLSEKPFWGYNENIKKQTKLSQNKKRSWGLASRLEDRRIKGKQKRK